MAIDTDRMTQEERGALSETGEDGEGAKDAGQAVTSGSSGARGSSPPVSSSPSWPSFSSARAWRAAPAPRFDHADARQAGRRDDHHGTQLRLHPRHLRGEDFRLLPHLQDYGEWTDTRISVTHPRRGHLGNRLRLHQERQEQRASLHQLLRYPLPASGSARPGDPYIVNNSDNPIQPSAARVGDTITIYGMNFGLEKGASEVYFTWARARRRPTAGASTLSNLLPARDYNLDYIPGRTGRSSCGFPTARPPGTSSSSRTRARATPRTLS